MSELNPVSLKLSLQPDTHYPPIAPYKRQRAWRPLDEVSAAQKLHTISEQRQGLKVAMGEIEVQIDAEKLQQKSYELGIARLQTLTHEQEYHGAGHKLVALRHKVAELKDAAIVSGQSWRMGQSAARERVEALRLSVNEAIAKNDRTGRIAGLTSGFSDLSSRYAPNANHN